jgi:hypothetical protein
MYGGTLKNYKLSITQLHDLSLNFLNQNNSFAFALLRLWKFPSVNANFAALFYSA